MIEYKGYIGQIEFDNKAKIFHGNVINTKDVITFQGKNADEIEKEFKLSIDDYLKWCKDDNIEPEKPYSGKFIVRVSPELHKKIALISNKNKLSINKFVEKALIDELAHHDIY